MKHIILILAVLVNLSVFSQSDTITAFSESYTNETNQEYQKAIDSMLGVYTADSYSINFRLGWLYYLNGDLNKSKTYYQNAINLNKNSIEARLGLVYPVYAMQNTNEVIQIYKDILLLDTHNSTANYRLASIYYARKNWIEAEKHLLIVLGYYPFDYDTNLLLGYTYVKMGKLIEAKKVLNTALEYNPSSNEVITLLESL